MSPPDLRPPPLPDRPPALDQTPEPSAVREPRADARGRSATLTGMVPPKLPPELAPTRPAPSPWSKTVMRPTPPSTKAVARRSDPPPPIDSTALADASQGQPEATPPATPLPPSNENQAIQSLRRRAEEAEAELGRALRSAAKANAEALSARLAADSIRPDGSVASVRKAQTRLLLGAAAALAVLVTPLALYINALTAELKVRAAQATTAAESAEKSADNSKKARGNIEAEFRQYRANMREILRLQGVQVPAHEEDPQPKDLKPYTPLCQSDRICSGPKIVVTEPP